MRKKILYGLGALALILSSVSIVSCEPDYYTNDDPNTRGASTLTIDGQSIDLSSGFFFNGDKQEDNIFVFSGGRVSDYIAVNIKIPGGTSQSFSEGATVQIETGTFTSPDTYTSIAEEGSITVSGLSEVTIEGLVVVRGRVNIKGRFIRNHNAEDVVEIDGSFGTSY